MIPGLLPLLALSDTVEMTVAVACIVMAGGVALFAVARRRAGFDPMLAVSAAAVVALAVVILLTG